MLRFFNGKYGLGPTYWLGVFGVGVLVRGITYLISRGYLTAQDGAEFARLELFHNIFLIALSLYMLAMLRAMILAGFDNRRPGGWGWTGIVLTGIGACLTCFTMVTILFPSIKSPIFLLKREVSQLNRQLPQDMGDGMKMTRVSLTGNALIYHFRVDGVADAEMKRYLSVPLLDTPEGGELCEDFEGYFKGGLRSVGYFYTFDNDIVSTSQGGTMTSLDGAECLEWLNQSR